ncbi:molybdenum cofactor sulfurase [candidate division WOR-1 bacterium RIFOXYA12_FULL_52_29]|uniref:Molybdenum cofactor sulfurase n=1 Tax=candidate division WOR-1 bacterium RIFOXYC12_FULL_54_18 TaxID=1802584 RepID=A0A1F4T4P6_UNCSA|nr:MAG: molybdenum cofactor sulfurase [candidate division WOR-1 bacterium RIFOXYA2_FULL_51_19]OGC17277.1 MAG: molybdenum cofactor sulfurase [candidate division WOR-1 bacterium RIFOXYA12_FULL_52_29]OGC26137.1 MAG: molybdenum cofactor sulfurase [candidate division WOR-1 bacterium RIFOXYB2_FULL_45_9]OGC27694.1 MAG: molybdenum cofactor sulfurase [candidate division WOR-1 bacterium RIFOXYC12_FULL_54_18]OGC30015.1 MAG: molybdenum cofactor sulfurase [candidate division WOR-1 bacterium RIFOXYB12_FULL_5
MPQIKAVCVNSSRGQKSEVPEITLIEELGVKGDFHAKGGIRQVSLLANESIDKMKAKGLDLANGAFGENIVTEGINLLTINIGQRLMIGQTILEVSKIGKECIKRCNIYYQVGDCIMPREGIFVKVIKGGAIKAGDEIKL